MIVCHGVSEVRGTGDDHPLGYSAGVMVLSKQHPRAIRYRSVQLVLTLTLPEERNGAAANVVFPTGIDRRDDLGTPDRFDVYYGMADNRIGVARLDLPEQILAGAVADRQRQRCNSLALPDNPVCFERHESVDMEWDDSRGVVAGEASCGDLS